MGKVNELDQSGAGLYRSVEGEALDSMMAVGKSPWHYSYNSDMIRMHEEGTKITSKEVNEAAGLDWNVYQTPAYIALGGAPVIGVDGLANSDVDISYKLVGTQREAGKAPTPDYWLNVRDDINRVIGVVKKRYRVFQNVEAPIFLDSLVDSGEASYETAGSLYGGSQVWWLMKLPEGVTVAGDEREKLETYILLTNSHDGSTSIVVAIVTIRVVCQNTLAYGLSSAIRTTKIKHTESAPQRFMEARRVLEIGFSYQQELAEMADKMLNTSFSDEEFQGFLDSLIPTPEPVVKDNKTTNQRGITLAQNTKGTITHVYYQNPTQESCRGTVWGAVQACQFYADHLAVSRNTEDASADENRFKRLTQGVNLGSEAFNKALVLV